MVCALWARPVDQNMSRWRHGVEGFSVSSLAALGTGPRADGPVDMRFCLCGPRAHMGCAHLGAYGPVHRAVLQESLVGKMHSEQTHTAVEKTCIPMCLHRPDPL
jgi:hypothetical protein